MQTFLFDHFIDSTYTQIEDRILQQVATYLPVVRIHKMDFSSEHSGDNRLDIRIEYSIPTLNVKELLEFTI
jgi:hypothetical protein